MEYYYLSRQINKIPVVHVNQMFVFLKNILLLLLLLYRFEQRYLFHIEYSSLIIIIFDLNIETRKSDSMDMKKNKLY
ncbi:hypothetical protein DERP_008655 [Dermatophagoides pteronyssinus]|uniref:Uncharacterized protein n=1 Tax=Dermatophagoides pteronyssinus TaxID=6956 RepID=A0ABQ8IX13_DERPT|nr:hypothetical protein DERP_008655 [Dermatophagoides pteronyssinus]